MRCGDRIKARSAARGIARLHGGADEIEDGRHRLGGQRQRVRRLVLDSRGVEDRRRKVDVRQRPLEHDGGPGRARGSGRGRRAVALMRRATARNSSSRSRLVKCSRSASFAGASSVVETGSQAASVSSRSGNRLWSRSCRPDANWRSVATMSIATTPGNLVIRSKSAGARPPDGSEVRSPTATTMWVRPVEASGWSSRRRSPASSSAPVAATRDSSARNAAARNRVWSRSRRAPRSRSASRSSCADTFRSNASIVRCWPSSASKNDSISAIRPGRRRNGGTAPASIASRAAAPRMTSRSSGVRRRSAKPARSCMR